MTNEYPIELTLSIPYSLKPVPVSGNHQERLDYQTGDCRPVVSAKNEQPTTKQLKWVNVKVTHLANYFNSADRWQQFKSFGSYTGAMQHICQHAQEVRITWPEWMERVETSLDHIDIEHKRAVERTFFALQVGATVEYLPKEGEND